VRSHAKASIAIAAVCGIVLCLCASQAMAAKTVVGFFGETGAKGGQFSLANNGPGGAAVNLNGTGGASPGDVYVVDRGNRRVQQFKADGTWVRAFGLNVGGAGVNVCEVTASCVQASNSSAAGGMNAPQGIAIEQATGNVYVTDLNNRRIDVFSATGAFQGAFGWKVKVTGEAEELQLCTVASGCKGGSFGANAGQLSSFVGYPAINPANGHLLVADMANLRVDEFKPTISAGIITAIAFVRGYGWNVNKEAPAEEFQTCTAATGCKAGSEGEGIGQFAFFSPSAVAADSTGRVYTLDLFNNRVQAFSAAPAPEGVFAATKLSGEPAPVDIGVDSSNHLLVTKPCTTLACPGALNGDNRVQELDAAGNTVQVWAPKSGIPSSTGLGVGSGIAYMTTREGGPEERPGFFILGDPVPPAVTIDPVTTFTGTTATIEGAVHTDTIGARYHFEYSLDGATWTRVPANPAQDKFLDGDDAEHVVSVEVTGLTALSEYQVRLVAEKAYAGGSATAQTGFTTASAPPVLSGVGHSHIRDTTAQLDARINPQNEETEYHFEYTDQASFEAEGFGVAKSTPVPPGSLSGGEAKEVHEELSGLSSETTYRYRLLASNGTGGVESAVGAFTTYALPQTFDACPNDNQFRINKPAAALPDCRAYEQASPVDKNGGNVQSFFFLTKASPSGDRVSFEVLAGLPGGDGSQDFPTYLASRAGGEWSIQGMLPNASAGSRAAVLGWTPDFAQVFSRATRFGEGGLDTVLLSRSSEDGSLTPVVPYAPDLDIETLNYIDASSDGSIVLFGTRTQLPVAAGSPVPAPGLTAGSGNLYAWDRDHGELYLAGALPGAGAPAKGQMAGFASSNINETEPAYVQDANAVAADGSVYFTDLETGQLYRRLNPTAPETAQKDDKGNCVPDPVLACTVRASASEKDDGGGLEGHDAAGPQAAKFMAASTDGSKAIFTSSEKLTNDAYTGFEPDPAAIARADIADGENKNLGFLPTFADAIDVEGEYVYWTDPEHDRIGRARLDKSLYEPGFITGLSNLKGLAVIDEPGAQYIFWTEVGEEQAGEGSIGRASLAGGEVNEGCLTGLTIPRAVDSDASHIYWTSPSSTIPGSFLYTNDGSIGRADLTCNVGSVEPGFVKSGEGSPVVTAAAGDIAVDDNYIYSTGFYLEFAQGVILRASVTSGVRAEGALVVPTVKSQVGIALDGAHLYWGNPTTSKVGRSDLDFSSPEQDFIIEAGHPEDPAVDASHIYWSANQGAIPNAGNDLYSYDAEAPAGERLTDLAPEHDGEDGIEAKGVLGASADASYVYFVANGVPDAGVSNSPNANGEEAAPGNCKGTVSGGSGICNLYLASDGEITFIARLDAESISTSGESTSDAANWAAGRGELAFTDIIEKTSRVTPDGQTLLFRSQRQLTAYDNQGPKCVLGLSNAGPVPGPCVELYRYRVGEPGLLCVSCNPTGATPVGPSSLTSITTGEATAPEPAALLSRNLSANGDRVFFETPDALVAADSNADESCERDEAYKRPRPSCQDVYEWEAAGAGSCPESAGEQGCVYLLSTGTSHQPSFFGDASLSGDDAFIFTFSQLVRQDEDNLLDVYDARVEGGLASQDAIPPVPCEGEACKGGASTPPGTPSVGSSSFSAPGNPPAVHKKANKKKKKRSRAKKKHRAKKHHKRAKTTGRAGR
jgi:hypothetical protein